jgi:hypothetical protein
MQALWLGTQLLDRDDFGRIVTVDVPLFVEHVMAQTNVDSVSKRPVHDVDELQLQSTGTRHGRTPFAEYSVAVSSSKTR